MQPLVAYGIAFILGIAFGVGGLVLLRQRGLGLSTEHLAAVGNLAQALSVLVALFAVVMSFQIGTDQNLQQKRQYTRQFLDTVFTPERRTFLQAANQLVALEVSLSMQQTFNKIPGTLPEGGSSLLEGELIKFQRLPEEIRKRASVLATGMGVPFVILSEINACIDAGVCDRALSFSYVCNNLLRPLRDLEPRLSKDKALYKVLSGPFTDERSVFTHPQLLSGLIEHLKSRTRAECSGLWNDGSAVPEFTLPTTGDSQSELPTNADRPETGGLNSAP